MAILSILPGLEVTIQTTNGTMTEYSDDEGEPNRKRRIVKYVAAVSGQQFSIRVKSKKNLMDGDHGLSMEFHVDGQKIWSMFKAAEALQEGFEVSCHGVMNIERDGAYTIRHMVFKELHAVETDATVCDTIPEDTLGTIMVKVTRERKIRRHQSPGGSKTFNSAASVVSEKALKGKAISHVVSMGDAVPTVPWFTTETTCLDKESFAEYEFRYRSKAALRAMLILPHESSRLPTANNNGRTTSSTSKGEPTPSPKLTDGLSERELRVLGRLAGMDPRLPIHEIREVIHSPTQSSTTTMRGDPERSRTQSSTTTMKEETRERNVSQMSIREKKR